MPLLVKNKGLLLGLLPLLVEPAPALLPVVASVIKTPASSFGLIGVVFLVAGLLEGTVGENGLLGAVAVLLGVPGFVLATVLENSLRNFNADPQREFLRERETLMAALQAAW